MPFCSKASTDRVASGSLGQSGFHSFIPPLLQEPRYLCEASDHPFLLVFRSSGQEGLHCARLFGKEVVDRDSTRWSNCALFFFKRLLDSAHLLRPFPSGRPARVHGLSRPCWLFFPLLLILSVFGRLQVPGSDRAFVCSLSVIGVQL